MKYLTFIVFNLFAIISFAQTHPFNFEFNYQGYATDASNELIRNGDIDFVFSIYKDSVNGPIVYSESHSKSTSRLGHFSVDVGSGEVVSGALGNIDWQEHKFYLGVEMDTDQNGVFEFVRTEELMSVPYALIVSVSDNKPEGRPGRQGQNGAPGAPGATGEVGPQGPEGDSHPPCPGEKGDPGIKGQTGVRGLQGDPGYGPEGDQGPPGEQGPPGPDEGARGQRGAKGDSGIKGDKGLRGDQGESGPQGDSGPESNIPGPEGPEGFQGDPGGPDGNAGERGPKGDKGQTGPAGLNGDKGTPFSKTLRMTSLIPTNEENRIYLDDGTNRADGKPGFRYFKNSNWIDL